MNKNQKKYLLKEAEKIYNDKIKSISIKYFNFENNPSSVQIRNYIEANKLHNNIKLKFKNKQELINDIISFILSRKDSSNFISLYDIQDKVLSLNTWFDLDNITKEIYEITKTRKEKLEKIEEIYNDICDNIMFNTDLNTYIKNITENEDIKTSEAVKYMEQLENFEV